MAQSQVSTPAPRDAGESAPWDSPGAADEQPLDIWSRLPTTRLTQQSATVALTPDRTDISAVLSAWRAAERNLDEHIEASPMRSVILAEITRLRAEYQRLFTQAMK